MASGFTLCQASEHLVSRDIPPEFYMKDMVLSNILLLASDVWELMASRSIADADVDAARW